MANDIYELRLHIRVLIDEQGNQVNSDKNIDKMFENMRNLYGTAASVVVKKVTSKSLQNRVHLINVHVNDCTGAPFSDDHKELFQFRDDDVLSHDIVAYMVQSIASGSFDGCASHPPHKHGVMVASSGSMWTLAHEVGHLLLDFNHETNNKNLMFRPTHGIDDLPPDLRPDQICKLRKRGKASGLLQKLTPSAAGALDLVAEEKQAPRRSESRSRPRQITLAATKRPTAITMEWVKTILEFDEPDLKQAAVALGAQVLPYLKQIVEEGDRRLAPRALSLAAFIKDESTIEIFWLASASADPVIRLAAAYNLRHFDLKTEEAAADLLLKFLNDPDLGVRKFALLAVSQNVTKEVWAKIEDLKKDPNAYIRQLSDKTLTKLNSIK